MRRRSLRAARKQKHALHHASLACCAVPRRFPLLRLLARGRRHASRRLLACLCIARRQHSLEYFAPQHLQHYACCAARHTVPARPQHVSPVRLAALLLPLLLLVRHQASLPLLCMLSHASFITLVKTSALMSCLLGRKGGSPLASPALLCFLLWLHLPVAVPLSVTHLLL